MTVFIEISLLLAITTVVSIFIKKLKQPLVVGYILAGIITGPYILNVLNSEHELELFSKVGIVFLLFIVGLHLNPKVVKEVGSVSLITGLGQVFFTATIGFLISLLMGIPTTSALYIAIALTFSSTIIILKLLADKRDLQKLYAKIAIGFLLVQDIVATFILIGVTVFAQQGTQSIITTISYTLLKGVGIFVIILLANKYLIPKIAKFAAQSQELLFLFSLSWAIGLASVFAISGFSIEIGALIAGVMLASTPYADEISSRMKPLRDFFITIFFILLGSQLIISDISSLLFPALILSMFVLIGNPIIVMIIMNKLGYNKKTGFMAGLTVAQISEFSLILASVGLRIGHIPQEIMSLITLVGLITIAGSTYLIIYAEKIFPHMKNILHLLDIFKRSKSKKSSEEVDYSAVIFGYDRVGQNFVSVLKQQEQSFVVVDFNPDSIEKLLNKNVSHIYGDASDLEFLEELPLKNPKMAISTIPDCATNKLILKHLLTRNKDIQFIPIAHSTKDAQELYLAGSAYVVIPHHLGAEFAASMIRRLKNEPALYKQAKDKHLKKLSKMY
jgi:Kef-type K+ transport system membrane component KefB